MRVEPSILAILGTAEQDIVACQEQSSRQVSLEENTLCHTPHPGISLHVQKPVLENTRLPSPRQLGKSNMEQLGLSTTRDDHEDDHEPGTIHCTPEESPQRAGQQRHARKQHMLPFQPS